MLHRWGRILSTFLYLCAIIHYWEAPQYPLRALDYRLKVCLPY